MTRIIFVTTAIFFNKNEETLYIRQKKVFLTNVLITLANFKGEIH
jgi:hypothetical protein